MRTTWTLRHGCCKKVQCWMVVPIYSADSCCVLDSSAAAQLDSYSFCNTVGTALLMRGEAEQEEKFDLPLLRTDRRHWSRHGRRSTRRRWRQGNCPAKRSGRYA